MRFDIFAGRTNFRGRDTELYAFGLVSSVMRLSLGLALVSLLGGKSQSSILRVTSGDAKGLYMALQAEFGSQR